MREYKRHIKTALLIFLISLSFVLVVRLWSINSYFGTGFTNVMTEMTDSAFSPVLRLFKKLGNDRASQSLEYILRPKRIIINSADKRSIINTHDENYLKFYRLGQEIISQVESGSIKIVSSENVSKEEYYSALKSKSMLVDYENKYSSEIFSMINGGKTSNKFLDSNSIVSEYILNISDNVLNYSSLYIMDYNTEAAKKITLEMDKTEMNNIMEKHFSEQSSSDIPFYSFELNFHTGVNTDGTPAKVVFNPFTTIRLVSEEKHGIISHAPDTDYDILEKELLKKFNINVMSAGKYTDIDGSKNFVEKNANLKLSSEGYIEYISTDGSHGIEIIDKTDNKAITPNEALSASSEFLFEISNIIHGLDDVSVRLSGDVAETISSGSYIICFDYYIQGMPIFQSDTTTQSPSNAVIIKVENGYLKYYKQYIRTYEIAQEKETQKTIITAADELVSKMSDEISQVKISKAYDCFVDSGQKELFPDWVFEIDGYTGLYK